MDLKDGVLGDYGAIDEAEGGDEEGTEIAELVVELLWRDLAAAGVSGSQESACKLDSLMINVVTSLVRKLPTNTYCKVVGHWRILAVRSLIFSILLRRWVLRKWP